jgi:hypothetical protein
MTKSRKKKGGQEVPKSACTQPGMEGLCPKITENGSSLMSTTKAGIANTQKTNKMQAASMKLARGGGKKKKRRGGGGVICPQPAAGSGGAISAGASSSGKNMCTGTKHTLQQHASSTYDKQAKSLDINPPCDPFSGSCPSSGGGKRKRHRRKKRKTRRRKKRKTRRRKKRKTKRRKRKSRR